MKGLLIFLLFIAIGGSAYLVFGKGAPAVQNNRETNIATLGESAPDGSDEKFNYLVTQTSNSCGLQKEVVFNYSESRRIQGSCCNKMDHHAYQEQIEGLKKYKNISIIPSDPYDIPARQAKQLFKYLADIKLTSLQQDIYNKAMKMSEEGGPCCCKCWHWDAYEGLAKKLIVDYGWNSDQVAELWDLSDACGGGGHAHG